MIRKLFIIASILVALALVPVAGLVLAAVYMLVTAPVLFGISFISAMTFLLVKSAIIAAAVFMLLLILCYGLMAAAMKRKQITA